MATSLLFKRIYRYQSHDYAFSTVEKMLHGLGGDDFVGTINRTLLESLQKAGFSEKFLNEMVAPVMRTNYGQSLGINTFVGKARLAVVVISSWVGFPDVWWLLTWAMVGEGCLLLNSARVLFSQ